MFVFALDPVLNAMPNVPAAADSSVTTNFCVPLLALRSRETAVAAEPAAAEAPVLLGSVPLLLTPAPCSKIEFEHTTGMTIFRFLALFCFY